MIGIMVVMKPGAGKQDGFNKDFANIDEAAGSLRDLILHTEDNWQIIILANGVSSHTLVDAGPPPADAEMRLKWVLTENNLWSEDGTYTFPDGDTWRKDA